MELTTEMNLKPEVLAWKEFPLLADRMKVLEESIGRAATLV
jgi:hypothetical protein